MYFSVFTPTYNRGYILEKCYESLKNQTYCDFEWIIVDDGSNDNTKKLVDVFKKEAKFDIRYFYQKNSGKHIAHNLASRMARGELFVCVDSDDVLIDEALEVAKNYWEKHGKDIKYTGILAKRGDFVQRSPICGSWPNTLFSATMFDLHNVFGFSGDTVLFFKTSILKKVKFKYFEHETFMPETNLYYDIDKYGEMLLLDQVLYLCEYLPDGLTAHFKKILCDNPNGVADTCYKELCLAKRNIDRIKYALLTNMYRSFSRRKEELIFRKYRILLSITYFPAICLKPWFFRKKEKKCTIQE